MEKGQILTLDITDVAFGGDGVGRVDGLVVFAPFTISGETALVEIISISKRFARARLLKVIRASQDRRTPLCPLFGKCGGCCYQHIAYQRQVEIKQKQVEDALLRGALHSGARAKPMARSKREFGYRNRVELHGPGKPGFYGFDGKTLTPIDKCLLAEEPINRFMASSEMPEPLLNERLLLRASVDGKIAFSMRHFSHTTGKAAEHSNDKIAKQSLSERAGNMVMLSPIESFFQVNRDVLELMLAVVSAEFKAGGCSYFLDAHAGTGVFALAVAAGARECIGIDPDPAAVNAARKNADSNNISNCSFHQGVAEAIAPALLKHWPAAETCLFLDPPRAGCSEEFLNAIAGLRPGQLMYLSCSPPMLARDALILRKAGYELQTFEAFDMFPQTAQIETLAVFSPRKIVT